MALTNLETLSGAASGFEQLPLIKQVLLLVGLSASIALGVYVVLWSKEPNLVPMYAHLDPKEISQVVDALNKTDVNYKYDQSGAILVPKDKVHEVRMKLASLGLPKAASSGYEMLDKPQGFGTSQYMESVKVKRSIEGELARTITSLENVRGARVHLAIPKQSSFLKRNTIASASVMLDLYPGTELDRIQVSGIVHLVASSVSGLDKNNVTIIDQRGSLLSSNNMSKIAQASEEMNYVRQKEQDMAKKIKELLSPVYGANGVKAQVHLEMDFTQSEETQENYDKDKPIIRSESISTEQRSTNIIPLGVPGALSNQPPSIARSPELAAPTEPPATDELGAKAEEPKEKPVNYSEQATRNYEVDKSITYVKKTTGEIKRLSVAVVINDKISYSDTGEIIKTPLTQEEIENVKNLVKDAVGFNEKREDRVSVINASFSEPPSIGFLAKEDSASESIIYKPWFQSLAKQIIGGIFILIILFMVIKPILKNLAQVRVAQEPDIEAIKKEIIDTPQLELPAPDKTSQARIDLVKKIAHEDSKKTAQVVMNWVGKEDG